MGGVGGNHHCCCYPGLGLAPYAAGLHRSSYIRIGAALGLPLPSSQASTVIGVGSLSSLHCKWRGGQVVLNMERNGGQVKGRGFLLLWGFKVWTSQET